MSHFDTTTTLPNFLVVGAPKSGTTALYQFLAQHPDVYVSPVKEPHFFSYKASGFPKWSSVAKDFNSYAALFEEASHQHAIGEASTWYLYSPEAAEYIASVLPDIKIIALLRNPADRAFSHYAFNRQHGWEPLESFEIALDREKQRVSKGSKWDYHYLNAGLYHQQALRYLKVFGQSQVRFYLHDHFSHKPDSIVKDAFRFLEVDAEFEINTSSRHNATSSIRSHGVQSLLKKPMLLKSLAKRLLPENMATRLHTFLLQVNQGPKPSMSAEVRASLTDACRQDVLQLQGVVGEDLESLWLDTSRQR